MHKQDLLGLIGAGFYSHDVTQQIVSRLLKEGALYYYYYYYYYKSLAADCKISLRQLKQGQ